MHMEHHPGAPVVSLIEYQGGTKLPVSPHYGQTTIQSYDITFSFVMPESKSILIYPHFKYACESQFELSAIEGNQHLRGST